MAGPRAFISLVTAVLGIAIAMGASRASPLATPSAADTQEAAPSASAESQAVDLAARLQARISDLLKRPQPKLFERHLRSVRALIGQELLTLSIAGADRAAQAQDLLNYLRMIEQGLNEDGERPETYLVDGRRALTLARRSKLDGSLQYYTVNLPAHWDPQKAYPLFISLHGAGPALPISYVGFTFAPHGKDTSSLAASAAPPPDMIVIGPWLRGNQPWQAGGDMEADIWEAVEDLQTFARLDPDRWYIGGFSMGGDDTWALVMRTPDRWAAAGMMAGAPYGAPVDLGIVANASAVPFYFWSGGSDQTHRLPDAERARDALAALGDETKFVISPGVAHTYRWQDDIAMRLWLLQHVRRRPDHFSFVADTPDHRGAWGVSIPRKYPYDQRPPEPVVRFECWIDGQTVRIQTWDANALKVVLGPEGLRMAGKVKLLVNGRTRFEGAASDTPIALTDL